MRCEHRQKVSLFYFRYRRTASELAKIPRIVAITISTVRRINRKIGETGKSGIPFKKDSRYGVA
jgi:hypothetical protein